MSDTSDLKQAPLGKKSNYISTYTPDLLFPVARKLKRDEIHIKEPPPFTGVDIWNAYELSWLNENGKPIVACAQFVFPCDTPNIIESKSFKLYLNSFNNSKFESFDIVKEHLQRDLSQAAGGEIEVTLFTLTEFTTDIQSRFKGIHLDALDIDCNTDDLNPAFLQTNDKAVTETLCSDLLKSNCLVTYQPDWGSVQITYTGKQIDHAGLLRYIVSFRNHNEFHEQCVERIFADIMQYCHPQKLTVYARYTRRGGLDINPFRTNTNDTPDNHRLIRQ